MSSRDLATGITFLFQTVFGVFGNFSLFHYRFIYFTGCSLRTTDLILKHLIVANVLVLITRGIPQTMTAFHWKQFPRDYVCKFLHYLHRVGRGVSIGSTCSLSIFQAITISPRNSRWAELKVKAPKYISLSIALCWLLFMLVNIFIPIYLTGSSKNDTIKKKKVFGYCALQVPEKVLILVSAALLFLPDAVCLGLMLWACSVMVSILHSHQQQVQDIHRFNLSLRSSAVSRATQTVLLLVSTFVFFYTLSSILQICLTVFDNPSRLLIDMATLSTACFPTISPFLLVGGDASLCRLCFTWGSNKKSPNLINNI
ncbi:vomeronasal type-1 receptor 4-like [Tamandua tetradactyla]|uniref:vomeronasal type-1 receptor 4-like n=1 Tax=Tamandua tetradactyla TaxID=48850 RepID=UPI004053C1BC